MQGGELEAAWTISITDPWEPSSLNQFFVYCLCRIWPNCSGFSAQRIFFFLSNTLALTFALDSRKVPALVAPVKLLQVPSSCRFAFGALIGASFTYVVAGKLAAKAASDQAASPA